MKIELAAIALALTAFNLAYGLDDAWNPDRFEKALGWLIIVLWFAALVLAIGGLFA